MPGIPITGWSTPGKPAALPATSQVPRSVKHRQQTIGVRIPDHPVVQALQRTGAFENRGSALPASYFAAIAARLDAGEQVTAIATDLAAQYDICFGVLDAGAANKGLKQLQRIANVNDCSYMVSFADLLGNPEWMTGALFDISDQAPMGGKEVKMGQEWENILFDFDKFDVKPQYFPIIAKVAEYMRSHPEARIVLAGHTDNVGSREYNVKLSHRRASAVRDYLVTKEGKILDPLHQKVVLHAGTRDTDGIVFLESIRPDEWRDNLAGNDDHRNGVHVGRCDTGHGVRGPRARGHENHTGLSARARIAIGSVGSALLVSNQDVTYIFLLEDRVVNMQNRPARIAENEFHTLVFQ